MATYTVEVPRNKETEFLNFISTFDYLKIQNRTKIKEQFKKNLKNALSEVAAMEAGEVEKVPIEDFLLELRNEKKI